MCGIAGILDLQGRQVERAAVDRLCAQIEHRGPDDDGIYLNCRLGLGQRRLSVIDLTGGRQPMCNEDETVWITFNGEIYNFQELREELAAKGHKFASDSDTEAIVHAYEEYGVDCLSRLRGMFAFALWDEREQRMLLARDRVGKKPLVYAFADGQFLFASELQAIVAHPAVQRKIDPLALDDYLTYGYVPAPKSIYQGVYKLLPGHYLLLHAPRGGEVARPEQQCYWQLDYEPKQSISEQDAAEQLLEILTEAVRLRMIADVPLGALLSGGIDSSLVVALMSRLSSQPVKTFSIGFDDQAFNELPFARRVAQRYGTDHHELIVRPNALEVLPKLVRHYGEPYADSSAVPSYYVASLTRRHVKVALNGDGGDESFAGYERYLGGLLADRYQRIPAVFRRRLIEPLSRLVPDTLPARHRLRQARRFLEAAGQPGHQRYLRWVGYFGQDQKKVLYSADFQRQLAGYGHGEWLLNQYDAVQRRVEDPLDAMLALDVRTYLPNDLLVKMDIATMANSLEARSPFLDHKLIEFAACLPRRHKLGGFRLKRLLKKLAGDFLPAENITRRKMGFGVPVGEWMRCELRDLVRDTLISPIAATNEYFDPAAVRNLVEAHQNGNADHSYRLWSLLWLELWHREFQPTLA